MEPQNHGEARLSCPHEPTMKYTMRVGMCPECWAWSWVTTYAQRLASPAVIFDELNWTVLGPLDDVPQHLQSAVEHILNHAQVATSLLRYDARIRE